MLNSSYKVGHYSISGRYTSEEVLNTIIPLIESGDLDDEEMALAGICNHRNDYWIGENDPDDELENSHFDDEDDEEEPFEDSTSVCSMKFGG